MIARIWSGESPLWRLLLPLSWLYGLVSGAIRLSYKLGFKRAWRAPVPVVVVGNLTAGGNGKTPVVIWLVEKLQQRGVRVGSFPRLRRESCRLSAAPDAGDDNRRSGR